MMILQALFVSFAFAMQTERFLTFVEKDQLMSICLQGDPSLFRYNLLRARDKVGIESVCFVYKPWMNYGSGHSNPVCLARMEGKTIYDALFDGISKAEDKEKRTEEVKVILEIMWKYNVPECPDTYLLQRIITSFGYEFALKALKAGVSPVQKSGSVLESVFDDFSSDKDGLFEFLQETVKHPLIIDELQKGRNPLAYFARSYDGSQNAKDVLHILIEAGAKISREVMDFWIINAFNTYKPYTDGFADLVHAIPNPYVLDEDREGFQDVIEDIYKIYLPDKHCDASIEERKAFCYRALIAARSNKPAILCPGGRPITLKFRSSASRVFVTGTFDSWKQTIQMSRSDDGTFTKDFVLDNAVTYQFKFVADGVWIASNDYLKIDDGHGNINNVI